VPTPDAGRRPAHRAEARTVEQHPAPTHVLIARVPVALEAPADMAASIAEVLEGEYEAGISGEALTILDLGANVGSFTAWADLRWPRSTIHAFEPHPGTFAMLRRNVGARPNVRLRNVAVYPSATDRITYFARYDGDGQAGVAERMADTFTEIASERTFPVDAIHPSALPAADVVKLDVEGSEAEILAHMDLTGTGLIVLEYQNDANRTAIKAQLAAAGFALDYEDAYPWADLLRSGVYRPDLAGDHWGRMFFSRLQPGGRLRRVGPPRSAFDTPAVPPAAPPAATPAAPPAPPATWGRRVRSVLGRLGRRLGAVGRVSPPPSPR
jgi:FkbM family methyltransferase